MAELKSTITITEEDGTQTSYNADYLIGCMHAEGDPIGKMSSFSLGCSSILQMAQAKCHIDELFFRVAEQEPEIIDAYLSIDPNRTTHDVKYFKMVRATKETKEEGQ